MNGINIKSGNYHVMFVLIAFCFGNIPSGLAQKPFKPFEKPFLDSSAFSAWPLINAGTVSVNPSGKFCFYYISNLPARSQSLVIQSLKRDWKMVFPAAEKPIFTSDGEGIIYSCKDSLF